MRQSLWCTCKSTSSGPDPQTSPGWWSSTGGGGDSWHQAQPVQVLFVQRCAFRVPVVLQTSIGLSSMHSQLIFLHNCCCMELYNLATISNIACRLPYCQMSHCHQQRPLILPRTPLPWPKNPILRETALHLQVLERIKPPPFPIKSSQLVDF